MSLNRRIHKAESRSQPNLPQAGALIAGFCLLASLALFLGFALYQLDLPGFYYDEAFDLTPMLNLMHGEPVDLLRGIGLKLGTITYPVMRMDYMGSLNGYLTVPFMTALGPGELAARLQPIAFACLTLVLAFILAKRWFGWQVAALTALLLAVCPSFIWFSRQGITVTSAMTVFSLGSWILLDMGRKRLAEDERRSGEDGPRPTRLWSSVFRRWPFLLAGLCLGLGLWSKINFAWWIALTGVLVVVYALTHHSIPSSPHHFILPLALVTLGFLIGAFPFIYYNLMGLAQGQTPATLGLLFRALGNSTDYGVSNTNFLANVNKRLQDFATFLNGSYFWFFTFTFGNVLAVPTFLASLLIGSLLAVWRARHGTDWRKWLALLLCIAIYFPISAFTVSDLWATHFYPILPLPQLVMACAAVWLGQWVIGALGQITVEGRRQKTEDERSKSPPVPRFPSILSFLLALALLAPTFTRDIWVNQRYHAQLAKTGGSGRFSDAIYKLTAHLDAERVSEPIALDWGIAAQVRVLTGDRVRPREIFGFSPEPTEEFRQQARELLQDSTREYIVLWGGDGKNAGFAVYNRRQEFTRLANEMGRHVIETFIAHERSGLPVYVVLQAK